MRQHGEGERRADIGIDVGDAEPRRHLGEVADPVDPPGRLERRDLACGRLRDRPVAGVIDNEVELRPVARRGTNVVDARERLRAGHHHIGVGGQQPLVDAQVDNAGRRQPLIGGRHQRGVVEPPAPFGRRERLADGIALPAVGADVGVDAVDLVEPARHARRDHRMRQQPALARHCIDCGARRRHLVVRQHQPGIAFGRRTRQQRDLGVAVDEDVLQEMRELDLVDAEAAGVRQPEQLRRQLDQPGQRFEQRRIGIVLEEMHLVVEDELVGERVAAALGLRQILSLAVGNLEMRAEAVVQRLERGRHAGRATWPPRHHAKRGGGDNSYAGFDKQQAAVCLSQAERGHLWSRSHGGRSSRGRRWRWHGRRLVLSRAASIPSSSAPACSAHGPRRACRRPGSASRWSMHGARRTRARRRAARRG